MTTTRTPSAAVAARLSADNRRRRTLWTSLVVVVVLVAAGIFGYQRFNSRPAEPVRFPTGIAAGDDTGIASGSGAVTLDVYSDFLCPNCKEFEESTANLLDRLAQAGRVKIVTHPVAFLDRMSKGSEYSTRASAASGCAADGGRFGEFSRELFRRQPAENTPGLADDELIGIGRQIGLPDSFADCVRKGTYRGWATHVTENSVRRGVTGTPTVKVDGRVVDANPASITAALAAVG